MYRGIEEPLTGNCNYYKYLIGLKEGRKEKGRFHNMCLKKAKLCKE